MSNQSGDSNQAISLPKGGGALHGIGEKFSPDLFTGTGNFTIPISLPSGRNDFQPELNLVYSTGNGNGPFGLGWQLSIPGISRKTAKGVPRYDDAEDTFILSGAEDLVPVIATETETHYRPRTEGLFAQIIHHHDADAADNYWEVRSKDGLVSIYGSPEVAGRDPAVIADPANRRNVFAWKLTETRDSFGNRIKYTYKRDMDEGDFHHWDQLYLEQIQYVDYPDGDETQFLATVTFYYEKRPDPFSGYRSGFDIRTRERCTHIETHTEAGEKRLIRTYHLSYRGEAPLNGASLLSGYEVEGHDGERTERLPPLVFNYTRFEPDNQDFYPLKGRELPFRSLSSEDLALVDLFGNGMPDILEMNGTVRYWKNLGNGEFDLPRPMSTAPAGVFLSDPDVRLLDANGDGRPDLLVNNDRLSGYYPLRFSGEWDRASFQRTRFAPSFSLFDPEVQLVDLDGDGVTDAIRSGSRLECYFNDPKEGWNRTRRVERHTLDEFPNVNFSDPRVRWADMTGDGLQDIVLIHDGNIEYWPNQGHGDWGQRVFMHDSPRFPHGYDPARILVGDVDGSGPADLVYVDHDKVFLWINQSGNGWSRPIEIEGTPPVTDMDAVQLIDMLGAGVGGVLWTKNAVPGTSGRSNHFFLDLTGGVKPYLLNEMDNNLGAITRVDYAPSTRFYLADAERLETRWQTQLSFPVQVVASVEVIDRISGGKLTTEYSYHHGYWDGGDREFRGFGRVDQRDTETFDAYHTPGLHPDTAFTSVDKKSFSPPLESRTWFHQGPIGDEFGEWEESDYSLEFWADDPNRLERPSDMRDFVRGLARHDRRDAFRAMRGRILRRERYALDGSERESRPYTVEERVYGVREEEAPDNEDRHRIFFPHTLAERTTQWERGDDPMTQITYTADYDDFGQPRQQTTAALPRRQAKRRPMIGAVVGALDGDEVNETRILAIHTRTEYAKPDPGAEVYIYDRVAQVRTFELTSPGEVIESDPDSLQQALRDQADAAYKEVHQRFRSLLDVWAPGDALPEEVRLIGHRISHYDGEAFTGLPPGKIGDYGGLTRREILVFTDRELDNAYGDRRPAYLGGTAGLPDGAPSDFPDDLGYRFVSRSAEGYHEGYYADARRVRFDFQNPDVSSFDGLITGAEDALQHRTEIEFDAYRLLPILTQNAAGLETKAEYDYRMLQPKAVTDPNGNTAHIRYAPLGLVEKRFLKGRDGEGGTEDEPEILFSYDFRAYQHTRDEPTPTPIYVHSRQRIWHANDHEVPAATDPDEVIESREYSDGFGRLLQTRSQAEELAFGETGDDLGLPREPGSSPDLAVGDRVSDRVVVSGWKIYDNKGQTVEKYEPFFASGWDFQPEAEARRGQHVELYYDPRGQNIRTVNPDGSEQRVIFGIPDDLTDPETFAPTPWESYTYDANDLAPLSDHPSETLPGGAPLSLTDRAPDEHHFTPASTIRDALSREICLIERNGSEPGEHWFITRQRHDLRDNLLQVIDALGRPAFQYTYDLMDNRLRNDSIDAGLRTSVFNANGDLVEYRDSKGSLTLHEYDRLNRLTQLWARDNDEDPVTLREQLTYGDGGDPAQSESERDAHRARNRLGQLYQHYDEAGLLRFNRYDFKGNLEDKTRRVVSDEAMAAGWIADWSTEYAGEAMDEAVYQTNTRFDALNRPVEVTYPKDVNSRRAVITPRYNRAGALERVELDGEPYVRHIAYNAKGQRVLIAYGNGLMTRYVYDPRLFRLARLRSEKIAETADPDTWEGRGTPLQDLTYAYDLAGNILTIEDRTPNSGIADTSEGRNRLVRRFEYDPLYRLTHANGRACRDIGAPHPLADLAPRCGAPTLNLDNAPEWTEPYVEDYRYDPMGNMIRLGHRAGDNRWARRFGLDGQSPEDWANAGNNRLTRLEQGDGGPHTFRYDDNGNLIRQNGERRYIWDHADRLIGFSNQPDGAATASVEARYLYDADGMRVKRWVRTNGMGFGESTVYIDDIFEHHRWPEDGATRENNRLHVMDDQKRIALVRRGPAQPEDAGPQVQYRLDDHLGSNSLVIGEEGDWINREEYFPYGETSFGSFARKRYRHTAKERDGENGFYYHGARYYAPWLGKWVSSDPEGTVDGFNLYRFNRSNPMRFIDSNGTEAEESKAQSGKTTVHAIPVKELPPGLTEEAKEKIDPGEVFYVGQASGGKSGFQLYETPEELIADVPEGALLFRYDPSNSLSWSEGLGEALSGRVAREVERRLSGVELPGQGEPSGRSLGEDPVGATDGKGAGGSGSGPEPTAADWATAFASGLSFMTPNGEGGEGIPGGLGSLKATEAMKWLYAFAFVGTLLSGPFRAMGRGGKAVSGAMKAAVNRVRGLWSSLTKRVVGSRAFYLASLRREKLLEAILYDVSKVELVAEPLFNRLSKIYVRKSVRKMLRRIKNRKQLAE